DTVPRIPPPSIDRAIRYWSDRWPGWLPERTRSSMSRRICCIQGTSGLEGAQRGGRVTVVDDRQAVRRAGDRHVQVVPAVLRLAEDAGRVRDDHPVELKALGLGDR